MTTDATTVRTATTHTKVPNSQGREAKWCTKRNPRQILDQGTDWRFLNELKRGLKG